MKGSYIPFDQHDSSTKMVLELLSKECKPLLNATESSVDIPYMVRWPVYCVLTIQVDFLRLTQWDGYLYLYLGSMHTCTYAWGCCFRCVRFIQTFSSPLSIGHFVVMGIAADLKHRPASKNLR